MTNEIVKIDAPELKALEQSKAEQIKKTFEPMAKMLTGFEASYNELITEANEEITQEVTAKAKRLRLNIGQVRIETGKLKDKQKEYIKLEDKAIMGVHNILVWAVKEKEDKLKEIEKHFEIQEQKRLEKLQADRAEKLSLYVEDAYERDLAKFAEDEFEAFLAIKKKEKEDIIAAEKKAEEERIERERKEAERRKRYEKRSEILKPYWATLRGSYANVNYTDLSDSEWDKMLSDAKTDKEEFEKKQEKQRKENERLRKEAKERERLAKIEAEKRAKEEAERKAKEKAELKKRAEKERKERAEYEAKLTAEREAREKIEREERAKREKLEAKLKAKEEAERKAKEEEDAKVQAELSKGDAAKVNDLIADLKALKTKYAFKSAKNKKMYADVSMLIDKVINHIKNGGL